MSTNLSTASETTSLAGLPEFDEDGFVKDSSMWTRESAELIANLDEIGPLTSQHWSIIDYVREYYKKNGAMPLMRHACRAQNLPKEAVYSLFGGCKRLWRVAGLPNPGEEAKAYMS